jgi:hypothetical protein
MVANAHSFHCPLNHQVEEFRRGLNGVICFREDLDRRISILPALQSGLNAFGLVCTGATSSKVDCDKVYARLHQETNDVQSDRGS